MDERGVIFRTKNGQTVTLAGAAFLERFLQHVLPKRFVKIRHYGLHAPAHVHADLEVARVLLAKNAGDLPTTTTISHDPLRAKVCPICGLPELRREPLPPPPMKRSRRQRGPP